MAHDSRPATQSMTTACTVWVLTGGAFFAFFVFGFVDNLKGPILPVLLRDMELNYSQGGSLLLGAYVGFLMATLATGFLSDLVGNRVILAASGILLSAGVLLFSQAPTYLLLALAMVLIGLGMGAIEVGGNAIIVEIHDTRRGTFLNLLGVFHGTGSFMVPFFATFLLTQGVAWRVIYQFTLVLTVGLALYFLIAKYPRPVRTSSHGSDLSTLGRTGFTRQMLLYYASIALYVAAELGVAAWLVEFLQVEKGMTPALSALYLSLFFIFIMLGRLAGSFVVERVDYLLLTLLAAIVSTGTLAIGIFGPPALALFIPITGFFFSIIFPTLTASVSRHHAQNMGAILGVLFAFGGLGGALGPWAIGVASDRVGIQRGFALTVVYCLILIIAVWALGRLVGEVEEGVGA